MPQQRHRQAVLLDRDRRWLIERAWLFAISCRSPA
jgi:hypothetical protein